MKSLAEAALVGLARAGELPLQTDDGGERLLGRASALAEKGALSAERAFLLRLGVQALRRRAGWTPTAEPSIEKPTVAPPETRPVCSPALASIVVDLCRSRRKAILVEALTRMDAKGLRLPAAQLTVLAELRDASLLPTAAHVVGERGRWLAGQNPAWRWLVDGVAPTSPEARRRVWEEGTAEARLTALRAARQESPAEARRWIADVWKAEKASLREDMLVALVAGLSPDDQPVLEMALTDRAAGVRAAAAQLLVRLETSPLATRARERANAVVDCAAPPSGMLGALKARLAGNGRGTVTISPPATFERAWADDGLLEKPPAGTGARAFWLGQILASVSPTHWETRCELSPTALVEAVGGSEWAEPVLAAWTEATVRFDARTWAEPLFRARATPDKRERVTELGLTLFPRMDAAVVHEIVAKLVADAGPQIWQGTLGAVPRPWSEGLSQAFAKALGATLDKQLPWLEVSSWRSALDVAGAALPLPLLGAFMALEPPPEASLQSDFESFRSVLAIRKRIAEETRL